MMKIEGTNDEILYECLDRYGQLCYFFEDGTFPVFTKKIKMKSVDDCNLERKTGRTLRIDMNTWEIYES